MKITFAASQAGTADALVVGVYKDRKLAPAADLLDKTTNGALQQTLATSYFKGEEGETLNVTGASGSKVKRIVLLGLGENGKGTEAGITAIGGKLAALLRASPAKSA